MNITTSIEPPPRRRTGCCGKGCLIFLVLLLLLAVALVGGGYYGLRHYYLAPDSVPLSLGHLNESVAADGSQEGMAQTENEQAAKQQIDQFRNAARDGQAAHSELSAEDINALIERDRKSRGLAAVAIDGDTVRVETSIPLNRFDVPWQRALGLADRYLNARFSITSPADGDLANLHITDLVVNNHSVPGDALDFRIMGRTPRQYLQKYAGKYNVSRLQIANGKLVLESDSSR